MLEVKSALPFLVSIIVISKEPGSLQFSVSPGINLPCEDLKRVCWNPQWIVFDADASPALWTFLKIELAQLVPFQG